MRNFLTQRKHKLVILMSIIWSFLNTCFHFPFYKCESNGQPMESIKNTKINYYTTLALFIIGALLSTILILVFNMKLLYIVFYKTNKLDKHLVLEYADVVNESYGNGSTSIATKNSIKSIRSLKSIKTSTLVKNVKNPKLNCLIVFIITFPLITVVFIQFYLLIIKLFQHKFSMYIYLLRNIIQPTLFILLSYNNFLACCLINQKFRHKLFSFICKINIFHHRKKTFVYDDLRPKSSVRI